MQLRSNKRQLDDVETPDSEIPPKEPPITPKKPKTVLEPDTATPVEKPRPLTTEEIKGALKDREKYEPQFVEGIDYILKIDPSLKDVISDSVFPHFMTEGKRFDFTSESFMALSRGIIGQQVSGAAAKSIINKFVRLFHPDATEEQSASELRFPAPSEVLQKSTEELRSAGLSGRKVEYIRGVAEAFNDGVLSDDWLLKASDDEVVDSLVALKGIGPWSADMFLLFTLRRMDVFSVGDLGVQRGMSHYIKSRPWIEHQLKQVDWSIPIDGLHSPGKSAKAKARKPAKPATANNKSNSKSKWKVPEQKHMEWIANLFKPYRTAFQMVAWKMAAVDIEILEGKKKGTAYVDE